MDPLIAKVLIASQAQSLDRLFDYKIPEGFQGFLQLGARVIVPFQNRPSLGIVWEFADCSEFAELKEITEVLDDPPLISEVQYQLVNWLAGYYFCNRLEVVKLCLPPGANLSRDVSYQLLINHNELETRLTAAVFLPEEISAAINQITAGIKAGWTAAKWREKFNDLPKVWHFLIKQKLLHQTYHIAKPKINKKVMKLYHWIAGEIEERTQTGIRVKNILTTQTAGLTAAELCAAAEISSSVIKRLLKEEKINVCEVVVERIPAGLEEQLNHLDIGLSSQQQKVFQQIQQAGPGQNFLLHGITGSGKTEVYLEAATEVINQGKQVLYLVPEIALTPQTLARARNRFGEQVALIHSNMSDGERYDQWFRIKNEEAKFVLGARSALFAPFEKLGLIVVDEEHENTYKQEESPRYHTRQVVEKLAEVTGAKVVFGSATPSIEAFFQAQTGKYNYLQLSERFNQQPLPEVTIIDMRDELKNGNKNVLSRILFESITECLACHEQVILLLNRRGHSTFILCRDCGKSLRCSACEVALTYHLTEKTLRCHYCDFRSPVPDTCPDCGSNRIRFFGHGTQKLEEELAIHFPAARIVRMDVDSTTKKGSHQQIYRQLTNGSVDILLGTQMVAKGLDLPNVTLVGVISADSTLNIPDFRAAERTFQLLTQVAGRTGRGTKPGRVIFQAYDPEHYSLNFAKEHDYSNFYQKEIAEREILNYPPYTEMIKIGFSGLSESKVSKAADEFYQIVKVVQKGLADSRFPSYDIEVLGPAPTLVAKVQNNYRWQLLLKSNNQCLLEQLLKLTWEKFDFRKYSDVKFIRDRNPYLVV